MSFALDILELPGAIAQASWNDVPFFMPDSRHQVGRRVQEFFFPGQDAAQFLDLGAFDGPMRVQGILTGDLYVQYAKLLAQALRTPGPGVLMHPWLGSMQMVLLEPAEIAFAWQEQRVVRFRATFAPFVPPDAAATSTLDALLLDLAAAQLSAQNYLGAALAPAATSLWLGSVVEDYVQSAQGYWQAATGAAPGGTFGAAGNPQLAAAVAAPIAALGATPLAPGGTGYAGTVGALIAGVPTAIVGASTAFQTPAVGPGDAAVSTSPIDGRVTMTLLLAAMTERQAQFGAPGLTAALALADGALCALGALQAATTIAWTSAQEAQATLAQLLGALDAVAAQAAVAAVPTVATTATAVQAALLWTALQSARSDLIADMTATIGRLPQVRTVTLARTLPAWLVANILAGDTPALIQPTYADIIARNGVANPALVGPGDIEVLLPASLPSLLPGTAA